MILTKLTVSGFGKLKGYSTTFDKELNTFVFENGWGKTTLSDFIYAMFYGLAQTTKKKLTENLRKKYQPWDSKTFGGSVEFIHNVLSILYFLPLCINSTLPPKVLLSQG